MMLRAVLILAALSPLAHAERWKVQYFFDELNKTFYIEDLAFPSATHGIAVGTVLDDSEGGKAKYVAVITNDGGEHWTTEALHDHPRSIFFLDDSTGWMVGDEFIWSTADFGHNWKRLDDQKHPNHKVGPTPPGGLITRLWFLDAQHGFAAGLQKSMFETHDGGRSWKPVEAASEPSANPAYASYNEIYFENSQHGIVAGGSRPPRPGDPHLPSWMDPERAMKRREVPTLTFMLETTDGGGSWHMTTAPLLGNLTSVKLLGSNGLAVFGFAESFEWPSEVYRMDLANGKSTRTYREKDRRVMDCALFKDRAYLAAVEPPGKLNTLPIPGKVKILTSGDLENWSEMDVDYKALARTLVLAGPDASHLWAATDTGMILRLTQ